jgi:hypothetical protein
MSDTPRTDAAQHNMGSVVEPHYVVDADFSRYLERELVGARAELAEAKEQLHLCNVDQFTTAAELANAVAAERERCARVCDEMDESFVTIYGTDYTDFQNDPRYLQMAADAIRKGE